MRTSILLALFLASSGAQAQVFKCTQPGGGTSFSYTPCEVGGGESEQLDVRANQLGVFASQDEIDRISEAAPDPGRITAITDSSPPARKFHIAADKEAEAPSPPPELETREAPYIPGQNPLYRQFQQGKNKMEDPRPEDASRSFCKKGRPSSGVKRVGQKEIWPGMRASAVRSAIGGPDNVNSFLVGQEYWSYRLQNGGTLTLHIQGLCVRSIR